MMRRLKVREGVTRVRLVSGFLAVVVAVEEWMLEGEIRGEILRAHLARWVLGRATRVLERLAQDCKNFKIKN